MSYRTTIEGVQIFGNNDCYQTWIDFIKSQGIVVDADNGYEGEITDFMGAVMAIEEIVMSLAKKRNELRTMHGDHMGRVALKHLFDFSHVAESVEKCEDSYLFDELFDVIDTSYMFIPYVFFQACEEKLERMDAYSIGERYNCYKLKEGMTIHVRAK